MWHNDYSNEYKQLLTKFSRYGKIPSNEIRFDYDNNDSKKLNELRMKYNLEEIAGEGSEISRILNLFKWVKNNVIHDGAETYNDEKNAIEILKKSEEGKGVNCRMVATALCEVLLSMGFKSRFITGMPIGFDFKDCHVVNVVYSTELSKWIYLDPSTGFYLMNDNAEYLSYQEFRDSLVNDRDIKICRIVEFDELSDDEYIRYMTKNSFMLMSNTRFGFNIESDNENLERVYLVSKDYIKESIKTIEKSNYSITERYINNEQSFWELI